MFHDVQLPWIRWTQLVLRSASNREALSMYPMPDSDMQLGNGFWLVHLRLRLEFPFGHCPAKALAIYKVMGASGFVNLAQSVERMGLSTHMPCVTPRGEFYHLGEDRYILGLVLPQFSQPSKEFFLRSYAWCWHSFAWPFQTWALQMLKSSSFRASHWRASICHQSQNETLG